MVVNSIHFPSQICSLHPKRAERRTLSSKAVEKEKVILQFFYLIYLFIQKGFIKCSYPVSGNKHISSVKVVQTKGKVLKSPQTRQSNPSLSLGNKWEIKARSRIQSLFQKATFH